MKFPLLTPALLCAGLCLSPAEEIDTNHEPVELNFRYQPGKTYKSNMVTQSASKVMVDGQNMGTDQTITMDFTIKAEAIEDSENIKATVTYDRIRMNMNVMGQKMSFDSADPDPQGENPLAGMAGMAGKSLTATVTPKMEFIDLKGVDQLFEGLGEGAQMARGMFGDEQLKQMMGAQTAAMMPKNRVKAGDEWPFKLVTPMGPLGNMTMEGKSTMKGILTQKESKYAVVEYSTDVQSKEGEGQDQLGMEMEIKDGKMKTNYHLDIAEGYVTMSKTEMSMTILMKIPGQEEKLSVPSSSTVTITTQIK